jgi:hypothetical protein
VKSEPSGSGNCFLSARAHCESGTPCRAVFDSNQSCHLVQESPAPSAPERANSEIRTSATPTAPVGTNVRDIVQRSLKYESLDLAPPRDYIYIEDEEERKLNADGSVKSVTKEAREVMHLYGAQVARVLRKDGQDLPPDKARAEQARFDRAVAKRSQEQANRTPEAKATRQGARRKQNAEQLLCEDEFLKMLDPRLAGSEAVNGRIPNTAPRCSALRVLTRFTFKLWIDQAEYRWARFEGDNIAPVSYGKILLRVPAKGLHLLIEQTRHEDGAWLESQDYVNLNAKLLPAASFRMDDRTTYSGYRSSRRIPVS